MHRNQFSVISITSSLFSFIFVQVLIAGSIHGHISAFVNTDGKPNINTRPIRRPTVLPPPPSELLGGGDLLDYPPGLIRNLVKLPGQHQQQLQQDYKHQINFENPSYSNVNNKEDKNSGEINNDKDQERDDVTFTPYISARALSNIPGFFQHLRENLAALQLEQGSADYENDLGHPDTELEDLGLALQSQEDYLRNKPIIPENKFRWQPMASGLTNQDGYSRTRHNTRSLVERPPYIREAYIRRAAVSNYNPAWSYTKLGLGKRSR